MMRQHLKTIGAPLAQTDLRQQRKNPTHGVVAGARNNAPSCVGAPLAQSASRVSQSTRYAPAALCLRRRSQAHRWSPTERDFRRNPSTSSTTLLRGTRPRGIPRARAEPSSVPRSIDIPDIRLPRSIDAPRDALKRGVAAKSVPSSVACRAIITPVSDLGKRMGTWTRRRVDIRPAKPRPLAQLFPGSAPFFQIEGGYPRIQRRRHRSTSPVPTFMPTENPGVA